MSGDVSGALTRLVAPMREHLRRLDGDLGAATEAGRALGDAGRTLDRLRDQAGQAVRSTLSQWYGDRSGEFGERSEAFAKALRTLAENLAAMENVTREAIATVESGRRDIDSVIKSFIDRATPELAAAVADDGRWTQVLGRLHTTASERATETAARLAAVKSGLDDAAGRLAALERVDSGLLEALGAPIGSRGPGAVSVQGATVTAPEGSPEGEASGGGSGGGGHVGADGGGGGGGSAAKPRLPVAIPPQPGSGVDINLPGGATVQAPNEQAAAAVRKALSALGTPYVWAASNPPKGTDCSGLTMWSYADAGLTLPRHSAAQAVGAEVASADQLLPGDLIVWKGHVAMCIGNGQLIEAGDPVQTGPIRTTNSGMPFIGFYRPTG